MKARLTFLFLCWMAMPLFAQNSDTPQRSYWDKPGWYTFGLSGGTNFLQSDVRAAWGGWGANLSLGKNIWYTKPLLVNLRAKLEYQKAVGSDVVRDYNILKNTTLNGTHSLNYTNYNSPNIPNGFVFQNFQNQMGSLGLDAIFTMNRLRETTGWVLNFYGGAQISYYETYVNQYKESENADYKIGYAAIDTSKSKSDICKSLSDLRDKTYETEGSGFDNASNHWSLMPYVGFELGYELTPKFTLGIGHRVTWTQKDNLDASTFEKSNQDLGHYSFLNLEWKFRPTPKQELPPEIMVHQPTMEEYTTKEPDVDIQATIKNVKKSKQVYFTHDGNAQAFEFYRPKFASHIILNPGLNVIKIGAVNSVGAAEKILRITYNEPKAEKKPTVRFTNPSISDKKTQEGELVLKADITDIYKGDKIFYYVNGQFKSDYFFKKNEFSDGVGLREGYNSFKIRVENAFGSDEAVTSIYYEKPLPKPIVDIYAPGKGTFTTQANREYIKARIQYVESKSQIALRFNGQSIYDFEYSSGEVRFYAYPLMRGQNIFRVEASNPSGQAAEELIINFEEKVIEQVPAPRINFLTNHSIKENSTTKQCEWSAEATVSGVSGKDQVDVRLNGQPVPFSYTQGKIYVLVNVSEGTHELYASAINQSGRAEDRITGRCVTTASVSKPLVTFVTPAVSPSSTQTSLTNIVVDIKNISNSRDIKLLVNGKPQYDFTFVNGQLKANILVNDGANTVEVIASNQGGIGSASVQITKVGGINLARKPIIEIQTPSNGHKTRESSIEVKASIRNVTHKDNVEFWVNGSRNNNFQFNPASTNLTATISLADGTNTIVIKGKNASGQAESSVQVTKEIIQKRPPVISISKPADGMSTGEKIVALVAKIDNITSKSQIHLVINGAPTADFQWVDNTLTCNILTIVGTNTAQINATNADGSDQKNVRFTVTQSVAAPIINFENPRINPQITKESTMNIVAEILNVERKDIVFYIDGRVTPNFEWNDQTKRLTYQVMLNKGENNFKIDASNSAGARSEKRQVKYFAVQTVPPPTVSIESISVPTENPFEPGIARSTYVAKITGISNSTNLKVMINNVPVTDFVFNPTTGMVTGVMNLIKGVNRLRIEATNVSGFHYAEKELAY